MSQPLDQSLDPASHGGRPLAGAVVELTTDGIAASERLSYWRDAVLRRMEPVKALGEDRPFRGRLRRIIGADAELVEHASDAILAVRTVPRCRADACDDISIDLMLDCATASLDHGGERRLRPGDLTVVDYARPVRVIRSRHRAMGLILSRRRVREVLGDDLSALAGRRLATRGIGALLQSHIRMTLDEASHLSPAERIVAIAAAVEMACAVLQAESRGRADIEQLADGFYHAARRLIDRSRACRTPGPSRSRLGGSTGHLHSCIAFVYRVISDTSKMRQRCDEFRSGGIEGAGQPPANVFRRHGNKGRKGAAWL